ncbi:MAG TPA: hypothetical protein VGR28_01465 [Candidatus Thermoplasmatota archaeon]|jgi:hypothetical protein|nr:hypothetical protein [Candidatus Thermoplasmatota archaeon]
MTSASFAPARVALAAGLVSFLGILTLVVVGTSVIAGPPVSGSLDPAAIRAYYDHPALAWVLVAQFLLLFPTLLFAVNLREVLSGTPRGRMWATVALVAMAAEATLLASEVALQGAFVAAAAQGEVPLAMFRFWDLLYNSGGDAIEIAWIAGFSLAAAGVAGFPRWLPAYGAATAGLLAVTVFGVLLGIPAQVHLLLYLPAIGWWPIALLSLRRHAAAPSQAPRPAASTGG